MNVTVSWRSDCNACTRLAIFPLRPANCTTRWYANALCTDVVMRMPPRTTAARTGMMTSRSNRERTLQFFSALRELLPGTCDAGPPPCWPLAEAGAPCWPLVEVGAGSLKGMPPEATRLSIAACSPVRADACSEASAAAAVRAFLLLDHTALAPLILGPLGTRSDAGRSGDGTTCPFPAGDHRA